jgi:carbamoyltransferase
MKKNVILSFTLSGHGFSGVVCIDGLVELATSLERLTRVKNDILLPISHSDLDTFGWKNAPEIYQNNLDLPFDLKNDYSDVDFNKLEKFHLILNYLLDGAGINLNDVDAVVYSYRYNENARKFFAEKNPKPTDLVVSWLLGQLATWSAGYQAIASNLNPRTSSAFAVFGLVAN